MLFTDVSFKGFQKEIEKSSNKFKKGSGTKEGGFINPELERDCNLSFNYFYKKILNGKNSNLTGLYSVTTKISGDLNKINRETLDYFKACYNKCENIVKKTSSKNIKEYSVLKLYMDTFDILLNSKYIAAFKKAYSYIDKNSNIGNTPSAASIFTMLHLILTYFLFHSSLIITKIFVLIDKESLVDIKEYENIIEAVTHEFKAMVISVGFPSIHIINYLNSLSNPLSDLNKAIDEEKKIKDKMKSKENLNYDELSKEAYLVDNTNKRGAESISAITLALIIAGAIAGIILLIYIIRRALYFIGAVKIDTVNYIFEEREMLKMNVEGLNEKLASLTDKNEIAKLKEVIKKQNEWIDKFDKYLLKNQKYIHDANLEANDEMKKDDDHQEEDDFQVVL
jgi:hypothetical protein